MSTIFATRISAGIEAHTASQHTTRRGYRSFLGLVTWAYGDVGSPWRATVHHFRVVAAGVAGLVLIWAIATLGA